jgi:hypothetical protein
MKSVLAADLEAAELKEEKGDWAKVGGIEGPNDSAGFNSGGERREETVSRLLGGVL